MTNETELVDFQNRPTERPNALGDFQNRPTKRPLPDGWTWTTLGEVANPERNRVKPQDFAGLPFIGMDDVESETMRLLGTKSSGEMKSSSEHFWPDDVLYGSLRPYLNKVYRPDFEGLCSAEFIVFRSLPHLENKYLQYFLNQWSYVAFINKQNTGDRPRVKFGQMADYPFPLAPLPEQERIVAEIEKQFTRLDQAVASLRRLQSNLARYKASVLKAACDGRLVPQDPNDEPAADLLAHILAERRAHWQAANPGKKYQEVSGVGETAVLPELPDGWVWTKVDQLCDVKYGLGASLKKTEPDDPKDVPVIRIPNVTEFGSLDLNNLKYYPLEEKEREKLLLFGGDILFNWRNAPKWIGRTAVFDRDGVYVNASFLLRLRPFSIGYSHFVSLYLNYLRITGYFMTRVDNAVNQANFNGSKTKEVSIALPPLAEQKRIVAEVERRLSVVAATEQAITANLSRAERLRQSILGRAFTGQLV